MEHVNLRHKAALIYKDLRIVNETTLNVAYQEGMLRKSELVVGTTYLGHCRNAEQAVWKENNKFEYTRYKFGSNFQEEIVYPEDDEGYDIFVPIKALDTN